MGPEKAFDRWQPANGKPKFRLKSVTTKEVFEMVTALKNSHAYGIDKMDATVIKLAAPVLIPVITHVINLSLGTSIFPACWKIARVLPLLKSNGLDKTNPSSYRPVSQLPIVSKLTERSVQTQILKYLEESGKLHINHHGYRSRHSTLTALIQLMDLIATATDGNLITTSLSLDLSAAFDCVQHSILMDKISYYGFDKETIDWITSYLNFRSSFVVIGSANSRIRSTPHGVPQGSVMGPLLYLL